MSKRLSHSQINTYATCAKKYDYHYNHRLREQVTSAALLFGTALDNTLNVMLNDKKAGKPKAVTDYQTLVYNNWIEGKINDVVHDLPQSLLIAYADSDYDEEILTEQDILNVVIQRGILNVTTPYEDLAAKKKQFGIENLPENEAKFINYSNWLCLLRKGELMVASYYSQVLPQIVEVVTVQKKIELKNDVGDTVIGYIDAILDFGDGPRICDNKTAARAYDEDSANISPQLAVYGHAEGLTKTAFIVMSKQIKKNRTKVCSKCGNDGSGGRAKTCDRGEGKARCHGEWKETLAPEATIEIIKGDINSVFEGNVLDNYEETLTAINAGAFPRNFSSCRAYGRKCQFYNLCHVGEDKDLIKV